MNGQDPRSSSAMTLPDFIQTRREDVAALCRRHHALRLELFGSATCSNFAPDRSDLDFLVDLPPGGYADAFFGLKRDLEALFQRPVDLLSSQQIVNPYLRRRVDAERLTVYGA